MIRAWPLTGADNFQVLLDRHMRKRGRVGNVVRLALEMDPTADLRLIAEGIEANPNFRLAAALRMRRATLVMPKWEFSGDDAGPKNVTLLENCSPEDHVALVLQRDVALGGCPVHVQLVGLADGRKQVVISAHHALFDQKGMVNFARAIQPGAPAWCQEALFPEREPQHWWPQFCHTVYIMFYMLGSPFWFMARLLRGRRGPVGAPLYSVVQFDPTQAGAMEKQAWSLGARFGMSNFYLASTLSALQHVFDVRSEKPPYYWLSMPVSKRRKGSPGHLFGNNLTFVFARLKDHVVRDRAEAIAAIHAQVKQQLAHGVPARYTSLLDFFRRVPLWVYSTLVNLPMRGDYASLSFSDLGDEGDGVTSFGGVRVLSAVDYASVPAPPGLTVTFKRNRDGLQLVIGHVPEALSTAEQKRFHHDLVALLTGNGGTTAST